MSQYVRRKGAETHVRHLVAEASQRTQNAGGALLAPGTSPDHLGNRAQILKLDFYHWAMSLRGRVYTFSLNLREDVEADAKSWPEPCNWLYRRICWRLEQTLGRKVTLVAIFEESGEQRRLHVHGEFVVTDNEIKQARRALRLAAGELEKVRQHQVYTHDVPPDEGWASYCGKELWKASPSLRAKLRLGYLTDYTDRPIRGSEDVKKLAKELFEECRGELIKGRGSRSTSKTKASPASAPAVH